MCCVGLVVFAERRTQNGLQSPTVAEHPRSRSTSWNPWMAGVVDAAGQVMMQVVEVGTKTAKLWLSTQAA